MQQAIAMEAARWRRFLVVMLGNLWMEQVAPFLMGEISGYAETRQTPPALPFPLVEVGVQTKHSVFPCILCGGGELLLRLQPHGLKEHDGLFAVFALARCKLSDDCRGLIQASYAQ